MLSIFLSLLLFLTQEGRSVQAGDAIPSSICSSSRSTFACYQPLRTESAKSSSEGSNQINHLCQAHQIRGGGGGVCAPTLSTSGLQTDMHTSSYMKELARVQQSHTAGLYYLGPDLSHLEVTGRLYSFSSSQCGSMMPPAEGLNAYLPTKASYLSFRNLLPTVESDLQRFIEATTTMG